MKMERVLDQQGRWRNKVVAFRMSPEEDEVLEVKVKLSGLTKQEYIIRRLTDREITVVGNPRVYKALRDQMKLIYQELQRLAVDEEVSPDLLETLALISFHIDKKKRIYQNSCSPQVGYADYFFILSTLMPVSDFLSFNIWLSAVLPTTTLPSLDEACSRCNCPLM